MRRELIIIAGVLVPFGALVVLGWLLTRPSAELPEVSGVVRALDAGVSSPPRVSAAQPDGGADAGVALAPALPDPALEAPLRAIAPEVRVCFEDRDDHVRGPVTVRFRPTPDGGFDGVQVEAPGFPDPTFLPCVEDAFAEVRWQPTGRETFQAATHTFVFDPPRR